MLRDSGIVRVMAGGSARGFGLRVRGSGYKPEQLFGIGPGPAPGGLARLTEIKLTALRCAAFLLEKTRTIALLCIATIAYLYIIRGKADGLAVCKCQKEPTNGLHTE